MGARLSKLVAASGGDAGVAAPSQPPARSRPQGENGAYIDKDLAIDGAASGSLHGLTFALKDLFDVEGHRTGFGNPLWLQTHPAAEHTATVVQSLLAAGASLRGKTQMDEIAYSLNGENAHYGTPVNPAAPGRIPGGSSSGSAVATAWGDVDFAVGSDTGGSVRVPASYCGLFGIRPTHGRVSLQHARFLAPSYCTCGWFARDATMLRRVGGVMLLPHTPAAPAPPAKLSRFLVAQDAFELADEATSTAIYTALSGRFADVCALMGSPTEVALAPSMADPTLQTLTIWLDNFRITQAAEVWREHGAWVTQHTPEFGPGTKERFAMAAAITAEEEAAAVAVRDKVRAHVRQLLGTDGVLAIPTAPGPAPLCGAAPLQMDAWRRRLLSLTCIAGLAGLPQVHLPIAQVEGGLPVGLSLIGPAGSDEALLELTESIMAILNAPAAPAAAAAGASGQ